MSRSRFVLLVVALMFVAACGGGTADETTTSEAESAVTTGASSATTTQSPTATTTEAPAATTTEAPADAEGTIPEIDSGQTLTPHGTEDITTGPVVIFWYKGTGGTYLALYTGQGIAEGAGLALCPGNSIATTEFLHISNTPSEAGACDSFPTVVASIQVCDHGVWIYETVVPIDLEGTLFGSLEWNSAAGITGLTSQTPTAADTPEFEYGLASYAVPSSMTDDGSSVITCVGAST